MTDMSIRQVPLRPRTTGMRMVDRMMTRALGLPAATNDYSVRR